MSETQTLEENTTQPAESLAESEARREKMRARVESKTRRSARRGAQFDVLLRIAFVAFLLILWQGIHWLMVTRPADRSRGALFPSPAQVGVSLADGFALTWL